MCGEQPPAAPMNRPGKVGPPRKLPSEILQATPLNKSRNASVDNATVGPCLIMEVKASWPEKSTIPADW